MFSKYTRKFMDTNLISPYRIINRLESLLNMIKQIVERWVLNMFAYKSCFVNWNRNQLYYVYIASLV